MSLLIGVIIGIVLRMVFDCIISMYKHSKIN